MLGTWLDCALTLVPCLEKILTKARPKIRSLLRVKHMYSVRDMLGQFKFHVWSIIEFHNGALIMGIPCQVARLDSMQRSFLNELGLTEEEAFVHHNFAPLGLRRRIGILGLIHKRVLQKCHPAWMNVLPPVLGQGARPTYIHTRELESFFETAVRSGQRSLYNRSLYNYIHMYNRLPQEIVELESVSEFQRCLTKLAKGRAQRSENHWRQAYVNDADIMCFFHG